MKQEIIDKLPSDVRKEFMKYAIKLDQKKTQNKVKEIGKKLIEHGISPNRSIISDTKTDLVSLL